MPRPRSLSPGQLAATALAVIDTEGLAGLSMRAVGGQLGMSTMALYKYVDGREDLERLVVDLVLGQVNTEPPTTGPWRDRIEAMVLRLRDTLAAHPHVVPLTAAHRHSSPSLLRWSETVLGVLTDAGMTGAARVIALRGLVAYVFGALQLEYLGPLAGPGTSRISELSATEFPLMTATAREAARVDADTEFRGGLALLLSGIDAQ